MNKKRRPESNGHSVPTESRSQRPEEQQKVLATFDGDRKAAAASVNRKYNDRAKPAEKQPKPQRMQPMQQDAKERRKHEQGKHERRVRVRMRTQHAPDWMIYHRGPWPWPCP